MPNVYESGDKSEPDVDLMVVDEANYPMLDDDTEVPDSTENTEALDLSAQEESLNLTATAEPMNLRAMKVSAVDDEGLDVEDEEEQEIQEDFHDKIAKTIEYLTLHDLEEVGKILDEPQKNEAIQEEVEILRKLVLKWVNVEVNQI